MDRDYQIDVPMFGSSEERLRNKVLAVRRLAHEIIEDLDDEDFYTLFSVACIDDKYGPTRTSETLKVNINKTLINLTKYADRHNIDFEDVSPELLSPLATKHSPSPIDPYYKTLVDPDPDPDPSWEIPDTSSLARLGDFKMPKFDLKALEEASRKLKDMKWKY